MYNAYVTPLQDVRAHPNADRIKLATVMGEQVVVGLTASDGDLGIFFPTDGMISGDFLLSNNLYSKSALEKLGLDGPGGGFFDHKGRVRAQTFRGARSEGFWIPLSAVKGFDTSGLCEGDRLGEPLCKKYVSPQTMRQRTTQGRGAKRGELLGFPKHWETDQFRYHWQDIPLGSIVWLSEKLHGTSHRVGRVYEPPKGLRGWLSRFFPWFSKVENVIRHGTRNVVLDADSSGGFYGSDQFRYEATEGIDTVLRKGEVVYGEIVGFHNGDSPIMPTVGVPKDLDDIRASYGDQMRYRYGCPPGAARFYIYRIVQFNEDGEGTELSWPQVCRRARALGFPTVPPLVEYPILIETEEDREKLRARVVSLAEGPSLLDPTHIREGVAVRVEGPEGFQYVLKEKSFQFKVLEGIIKLDDTVADMEESS